MQRLLPIPFILYQALGISFSVEGEGENLANGFWITRIGIPRKEEEKGEPFPFIALGPSKQVMILGADARTFDAVNPSTTGSPMLSVKTFRGPLEITINEEVPINPRFERALFQGYHDITEPNDSYYVLRKFFRPPDGGIWAESALRFVDTKINRFVDRCLEPFLVNNGQKPR